MERQAAVDGVARRQRAGRRRAERGERPAPVGDPAGARRAVLAGRHEHHREVAGPARVGLVPAGQLDRGRVDLLHVDDAGRQGAALVGATEDEHLPGERGPGPRRAVGIDDQPLDLADVERARQLRVGRLRREQHRDRAEPRQRADHREVARPRVHHHADPLAGADAAQDQAAGDRVDPAVGVGVGEGAPLVEEEGAIGDLGALLGEGLPDRDPGVVGEPAQPGQPGQLPAQVVEVVAEVVGDVAEPLPGGARGLLDDVLGEREVELELVERRVGVLLVVEVVPDLDVDVVVLVLVRGHRAVVADRAQDRRALALAGEPADPADRGRPGDRERRRADHQPEVAGAQLDLVQLGDAGRGLADAAHRRRPAHRVAVAEEVEDRAGDVGERDGVAVDHEPARRHPVADDDLVDELAQRRPGPGDEALAAQEQPLGLALLERLAVVQLADEVDQLADLLARRQDAEAGRGQEAGQAAGAIERRLDHRAQPGDQPLGDVGADPDRPVQIDRAAEGDHRGEAPRLAVGGDLVREHPALRVTGEVDVLAGRGAHPVDRVGDGADVIVEGALHAALLALRRAEVDQPGVDAGAGQRADRADVGRDVVDLGGDHQRRHQQHRARDARRRAGRRVVAAQPVVALLVDDRERRAVRGGQPAGADDLERVLPGEAEAAQPAAPADLAAAACRRGAAPPGRRARPGRRRPLGVSHAPSISPRC